MKRILFVMALVALLVLAAGCKPRGIQVVAPADAPAEEGIASDTLEVDSGTEGLDTEDLSIDTTEIESLDM